MVTRRFPDTRPKGHDDTLGGSARLAALDASGLLDTAPEEVFDRAVRLATRITGTPVGLLSLVDGKRQFFKAQTGLTGQAARDRQTPLSHSFCQYVVSADTPLSVRDAREHALLRDNLAVGELGVVAYLGVPVHGPEGQPLGSFCAIDDKPHDWTDAQVEALTDLSHMIETEIALRETLEDRQLLLREMNHRVKNIFAIVTGIIRLSRRQESSAEALARALESRVQALAQAHELIVPVVVAHEQPGPQISLQKLVATLLEPHLDREIERVTIDGPNLILGQKAVTYLALVFHELATNAAKYGALADAEGRLTVTWRLDGGETDAAEGPVSDPARVVIDWREEGIAPPPETPKGHGFGTELLQISVERQLDGQLDTEFGSGFMARRITLPEAALRQ
ncbi:HWE histidine kinase domain-containing protein [Marinibacterium sp. SX1]|uniref:HWE histidine kinase domain-containing protein n=1 Tax=Marinibacterium sp. SX1 TaxID=3388424 RepID=UPI003D177B70